MIPKNIKKEHILKAIKQIDMIGVLKGRNSKKFLLEYNDKYYPPKYVISLANKFANDIELDPQDFNGGTESNNFLKHLGFIIKGDKYSKKTTLQPSIIDTAKHPKEAIHNERCPSCKRTVKELLEKIYGKVETNYKFKIGTYPEDLRNSSYYDNLKNIYTVLQKHRGFKEFIKAKILPNCDFFIPNPGFIVEFDESQHFTLPRKLSLQHYPQSLKLGYSANNWINLCEKIDTKDNDPPYRDEQRAWYDTLRDFLPVLNGLKPTIRFFSEEMRWCNLNPKNQDDIVKFKEIIKNKQSKPTNWVATVLIQSNEKYSNNNRLKALSLIVHKVAKETDGNGVILFPGGWFHADRRKARTQYKWVAENVSYILNQIDAKIIVSLGVDGNRDQVGIAINNRGIVAIGRKFHPAPGEEGFVDLAENYLSKEDGKSRIFELDGMKYFLCACYDSFGIKHKNLSNPGIDVILDFVHHFYKPGKGPSGAFYFARDGFAGASKQWSCPIFGAVVFINRSPQNWSSGVYWNQGNMNIKKWRYADNSLKPQVEFKIDIKEGFAFIKIYQLL